MADDEVRDVSFASLDEAIDARLATGRLFSTPRALLEEELPLFLAEGRDGRLRYHHSKPVVIAAWSEMCTPPPPFEQARIPTLIVVGEQSWLVLDDDLDAYRSALGDLLEVVYVPGGHVVFWDAFDETADAIDAFLQDPRA
jgi:pimeloyl-ACP methyl ester carboxylesterase